MNERKQHEAAKATRDTAVRNVRKQATDVVNRLQRDVLRLIADAHRDLDSPDVPDVPVPAETLPPEPDPLDGAFEEEQIDAEELARGIDGPDPDKPARRRINADLRAEIVEIVRAEIVALDIGALARAETEKHINTIVRQVQERLKASPPRGPQVTDLNKLAQKLSRRRL